MPLMQELRLMTARKVLARFYLYLLEIKMACDMMCHGCPFDFFSEESEKIQNYGCLPTPADIMHMRVEHGKSWACHDDNTKPCVGAIQHLFASGKPFKVIDKELVTEDHAWHLLCKPREE